MVFLIILSRNPQTVIRVISLQWLHGTRVVIDWENSSLIKSGERKARIQECLILYRLASPVCKMVYLRSRKKNFNKTKVRRGEKQLSGHWARLRDDIKVLVCFLLHVYNMCSRV